MRPSARFNFIRSFGGGALAYAVNHLETSRTNASATHTTGTITPTAGGTPTAGNVLWAHVVVTGVTQTLTSITGTLGGTWNNMTDGADLPLATGGNGWTHYWQWSSDFGASGNLVFNVTGTPTIYVQVFETTGVNETTPFIAGQVRASGLESGPTTGLAVNDFNLASVPTRATVSTVNLGQAGAVTAGTGWTEVSQTALNSNGFCLMKGTAVPGPRGPVCTWPIFTQVQTAYIMEMNTP